MFSINIGKIIIMIKIIIKSGVSTPSAISQVASKFGMSESDVWDIWNNR